MSVNGASAIFGLTSWIIYGRWNDVNPNSFFRLPSCTKMLPKILLLPAKNVRRQSWTIYGIGSWHIPWVSLQHILIIELLPSFLVQNGCDNLATMSSNWASIERQRCLAFDHANCKDCLSTLNHNWTIGHHARRKCVRQHHDYVPQMSGNIASMSSGLPSWTFEGLSDYINHESI
jgi:hypothetical protein